MNNPLDDILGAPASEAEETHVEAQAPETVAEVDPKEAQAAPEGPPRGPDGKFLPKAGEGAQAAPAEPAPIAPQAPLTEKETVGFYKAMQEERDKRQAEQALRQSLERQLAELKAKVEPGDPVPLEAQVEQRLYEHNLKTSRRFAAKTYGDELIATVHDWAVAKCDTDPIFNQQMRSSDDPYEAAMQAYNREQILADVTSPDDLAAFKAWKAAQATQAAQAPEQPPQSPAAPPPRSLANAPGTGAQGRDAPVTHPYDALGLS